MTTLFPGLDRYTQSGSSKYDINKEDDIWDIFGGEERIVGTSKSAHECPDCMTTRWVMIEDDEAICSQCGITLGFNVDSSAEYRWFGSEDRNPDPTRVGNPMNPLLPECSLSTRIMARPGENKAMRKIRQYHLWNVMPYRERTLWNVFEMLQVRASNAGISSAIVEETKQLYAQVSPLCICRGQQKDALMAACLFESLKRHDTPRRPVEIAEVFKINLKLITRGVKQFSGLLDEHLHAMARKAYKEDSIVQSGPAPTSVNSEPTSASFIAPTPIVVAPVATPSTNFKHYLETAILKLETPRTMLTTMSDHASKYGDALDELGICPETTPPSLAACALALTCARLGFSKSNAEIASVCGISIATLQKCLKRIEPWKQVLYKESGIPE